jgi:cell fate (sporulation/competence/biofilm development) regulator YmcA (YheA/YmcA/DUF963 family)
MSILKAITKKLAAKVVDKKINSLKKNLEKDSKVEEFDKTTQDLKDLKEQYDAEVSVFCRMHPDHPLCQKMNAPRYKK